MVVDKLAELVPANLLAVPLEQSFCHFVLRDGVFLASDTSTDDRLSSHPYKGVLSSDLGLPLRGRNDQLFGTFCHFDFPPRALPDGAFEFLQRAVKYLPPYVIS